MKVTHTAATASAEIVPEATLRLTAAGSDLIHFYLRETHQALHNVSAIHCNCFCLSLLLISTPSLEPSYPSIPFLFLYASQK